MTIARMMAPYPSHKPMARKRLNRACVLPLHSKSMALMETAEPMLDCRSIQTGGNRGLPFS